MVHERKRYVRQVFLKFVIWTIVEVAIAILKLE